MKQLKKIVLLATMLVFVLSQALMVSAAGVNTGYVKKITSVTQGSKKVSSVTLVTNDATQNTATLNVAYTWKTDAKAGLTVKSANRAIATADYVENEDGKGGVITLTAVSAGKVNVTIADALNPKTKKVIKVTVKTLVEADDIQASDIKVAAKGKVNLGVSVAGNATDKKVTYTSADKNVAKVDAKGNVTGVKLGETTVTIKSKDGHATKTVKVTVVDPVVAKLAANTRKVIALEANILSENRTADATPAITAVSGKTATIADVAFVSSNANVATVDANGEITAVGNGKATITAYAKLNEKVKATYKVSVTTFVDSLTTEAKTFTTVVGKKVTIKAATNVDASNKKLVYTLKSVKDVNGADVTANAKRYLTVGKSNGVVAGKNVCTAEVEIKAADPKSTAGTKTVTVVVNDAVKSIALTDEAGMKKGTVYVESAVKPSFKLFTKVTSAKGTDTANTNVAWSTSKASVATVDANGVVTVVGNGSAKITATSVDGTKKKASYTLTVKTDAYEINVEDAIGSEDGADVIGTVDGYDKVIGSNDGMDILLVEAGVKTKVNAATNADASNKKLEKYTNTVKLTAKEVKEISLKAKDTRTHGVKNATPNPVTKTVKVVGIDTKYVAKDVNLVSADKELTLKVGEAYAPAVKAVAKEANKIVISQKVTWTTDNKKVATVDKNGVITAKSVGKTTVTATYATNRNNTYTFEITVGRTDAQVKAEIDARIKAAIADENRDWTGTQVSLNGSYLEVSVIDPTKKIADIRGTGIGSVVKAIAGNNIDSVTVKTNTDATYVVTRNGAKVNVTDATGVHTFANQTEAAAYVENTILAGFTTLKDVNGLTATIGVVAKENGLVYNIAYDAAVVVKASVYDALIDGEIAAAVAEANAATKPSLADYNVNPLQYNAFTNTLTVAVTDGKLNIADTYAAVKEIVDPVFAAGMEDVVKVDVAYNKLGKEKVVSVEGKDVDTLAAKFLEVLSNNKIYEFGTLDKTMAVATVTFKVGAVEYDVDYRVVFKLAKPEVNDTNDGSDDGTDDGKDAAKSVAEDIVDIDGNDAM